MNGFARRGIINLFLRGDKVRVEINPDTARNPGLRLSAQFLSLAKIVSAESEKG